MSGFAQWAAQFLRSLVSYGVPEANHAARDRQPAKAPTLVAVGLGGRIELSAVDIRIAKGGLIGHLVEILWLAHGEMDKRIPLAEVSSVEIVNPMLLPAFIRVSYAGSPPQTGRYLADGLAENALMMNLIDNRRFYAIAERIARAIAGRPVRAGQPNAPASTISRG